MPDQLANSLVAALRVHATLFDLVHRRYQPALDRVGAILDGFDVQAPPEGMKSQAILAAAEVDGSIIVTSENWIYSQLRRIPTLDRGHYQRAGVVKVPGIGTVANAYLAWWLPVVIAVHAVVSQEANQRLVEIRDNGAVYIDP